MKDAGEIVGFDLGHGESAFAVTQMGTNTEPKPIEINGSRTIITAVGEDREGHIFIGEDVAWEATSLVESYSRFKHPDLDHDHKVGRAMRLFVRGIIDRIVEQRQLIDINSARFFVGCPSGWTPTTQREYEKLLGSAGLANVRVLPESRAAFLHARENQDLKVTNAQLSSQVLLIDVGSSTTDFTYSDNLNSFPIDFGHTAEGDIGAGQIDQLILEQVLATQDNAIREYLDKYPGKRSEVELKCRRAKEEFFNRAENKNNFIVKQFVSLDPDMPSAVITIKVDHAVMRDAQSTPITILGNLTWPEAFEKRLLDSRDKHGCAPKFILLTGGASRMGFLSDLVKKIYPEARLLRGKEPELAIAKGLASFGRADLSAKAFLAEVEEIVHSPAVEQMVVRALPKLYEPLTRKLAHAILRDIVRPEIVDWRNGHTSTLNGMERRIKSRVGDYADGPQAHKMIGDITKAWFEELRPTLHQLTDPICTRYGLPTSALDISADTHFSTQSADIDSLDIGIDDLGTLMSAIIATVTGMILGGSGIALLSLPLLGQIMAGILAFIILLAGKDAVMDQVKDWDIPNLLRRLLTDSKIDEQMTKAETELVTSLRNQDTSELGSMISKQIDQALRQRADDTILRFG